MHWNLPSNPIDLEQREGRINRYKCLAIRQDLAERFADRVFKSDVWQELFAIATKEIRTDEQSDLVPYWCLGKDQKVKIERIVPMYPVSKDEVNYEVGDNVKITDGPFKMLAGKIASLDIDAGVAEVTIDLFGQETTVELQLTQFTKE